MNNLNVKKNEDKDDEYEEYNSEDPKSDEIETNNTEEEEAFTDCLMSMNFPIKIINYVIGIISSCEQIMIEFVK